MLLTLANMKRKLSRNVPGLTDPVLRDLVLETYDKLCRAYNWMELETEFKVRTEQYQATGGVQFTNASKDVTAATTVSAAWDVTTAISFTAWGSMFIRKDGEAAYYSIASATSVAISLSVVYGGKTTTAAASSGDGYRVFQHLYNIDSNVETIYYLVYNDDFLRELSAEEIARKDPELEESGEPYAWRMAGITTANQTRVQIYPACVNDIYELRGKGKKRIESLTATTTATSLIDSNLIVAFATVDGLKIQKHHNANISGGDIERAGTHAMLLYDEMKGADLRRRRSTSKHVRDRFFGESVSRGHQYYIDYDSFWD